MIAAHIPGPVKSAAVISRESTRRSCFCECSHYCELVSSPEQIPQVLPSPCAKAVLNRVSVVVLPGDVALKPAPENAVTHCAMPRTPSSRRRSEAAEKLAQISLRYPGHALMCGSGCAGAHEELVALCKPKRQSFMPCAAKSTLSTTTLHGNTGLIGFFWLPHP